MPLDNPYAEGTIAIGAAATTVVGTGTFWGPFATQFCMVIVPGKGAAIVTEVVDDTHLTIPAWQGAAILAGSDYQLVNFPLSSLQATKQLRDFLEMARRQGFSYIVPDDEEPNDAVGFDADEDAALPATIAIRLNPKPIVFWKRVDGHYVFQGNFVGIGQQGNGLWDAETDFLVGTVASHLGIAYTSLQAPNVNHPPASSPAYWSVFVTGGSRFELDVSAPGRPAPGEVLIRRRFTADAVFPATLPESILAADVAATATAVFTHKRNGVTVGASTIAAANTHATHSVAADIAMAEDGLYELIAPSPADATLAGLTGTFVAYR